MRLPLRLLPLLLVLAGWLPAQKPVVAIGGIVHETNTFNASKTDMAVFEESIRGASGILRGQAIVDELSDSNDTMTGFIQGAAANGLEVYPTILAGPQTLGTVNGDTFDALTQELIERLQSTPKLDGILLFLHGTMVAESHPHADAEVVRRIRAQLGDGIPIVVAHDFHANVSEEIVKLTTALVTYKQNPHLDAKQAGEQAARILADTIAGRVKPVQAIEKPPMMYNLIFQNTYAEPFKSVTDESIRLERNPKILAASVPGGYQWSDIPAMGPSVIVVTDNDPELARREAKRLADMLWGTRDKLRLDMPDPAEAVRRAMAAPKFPVSLMDAGDNIGGGSPGDSTLILDELLKQKATGWVVVMCDPEANEAAFRVGVGGAFDALVGGKTDSQHGKPVRVRGRVRSLSDGRFLETEARHGGGRDWDMLPTAVVEVEGSTRDLPNIVMLTRKRIIPFSLHQLISQGIYPERQRILVAKGTIAPRAAYEPISAEVIAVDSPGVTAVNPRYFEFRNVREGLFGME